MSAQPLPGGPQPPSPGAGQERTGESLVSRVVRILEAFEAGDTSLTVTEIARRSGLHVATTSRLVAELVAHGLLTRGTDRRVRTGVRLWELAMRASPALSLREAAMPSLEDLHDAVGHHVQLSVLDGDEALFLERLSAPAAVVSLTRIAGRLPLHLASSGWVLLAHGPTDLLERVLSRPLTATTAASVTDPVRLRAELARVRGQGFALCAGLVHPEATGVAVPIRDATGRVIAALSAIVPNDAGAKSVVPALHAASRGVTRRLGAGEAGGRSPVRPAHQHR
ncbi:DNA-binding IclR family transcriptional regulator [Kineococcus xinjiangensis]|uniref:DNA-binding IclR family transcriptional regulator n=1 Tax=Kineococcus xinjiangensis TaxID=512762 RepID=A0A2S6IWU7_9ACTN|nr:IclR family transcriptional regulator [Kineococcus xinjiangensis]PPK98839.1 DNA-binding IclR family transcriptional regulator [Kineococcus xinjiangensis]